MPEKEKLTSTTARGLRTRYFPKNRIGQGFISSAPWLDIVLILLCFSFLQSKFVLQPGIVIDLPVAEFDNGLHSEMVAVVRSVEKEGKGNRREVVYFDDERFPLKGKKVMKRLQEKFAAAASEHPDAGLIIQADSRVKHGTIIMVINHAQEIGIKKVNVATRPL